MRKKILFFSHSSELYGAEKALLQTIEGLNKQEFHPILVLPRTGPLHHKAKKLAVETFLIPSKWWLTEKNRVWKQPFSWLWSLRCIVRISRLIKQKDIDLVFSNSSVNFCGALAARWKGVPHIWSIHEILGAKNAPLRFLFGSRALVSILSALSTKIIVNSHTTGQPFGKNDKVRTVYIGFNWSLQERGLREIYRQKFGFLGTDYVIGIVGKVYPEKGQKNVVESIGLVKKNHPDMKLLVVGEVKDKRYFNQIQRFIAARKLEERVIFSDYHPEIFDVLALLDLLVIASCVESFGRVAVEAMSVKTPVLAVRKGATVEVIAPGENGFLVDSPDPEVLTEAILSIRANPELVRKVGEKGYKLVREKYTVENQVKKTEEIVRECLGSKAEDG
jgi:glycosyltransferase involved in cell wall biosynthesis